MSGPTAFYAQRGERFVSSELTRGPWDPESQHAGPPAALIARAIERHDGVGESSSDRLVGRITFEILRPVPIAELAIAVQVLRPGRRVDLVEATLAAGDEALIRARAWRLRRERLELPEGSGAGSGRGRWAGDDRGGRSPERAPAPPAELAEAADAFFPTGFDVGYHTGMEYRFAEGGFLEPGPATCWMRMRRPLIEGERPTPLQRVLIAADSGNGISSALDFRRYLFINVDLTVHLHRMPAGEWVCVDARTIPEPTGVGLADALLLDERGPIGRACQTLLVSER